MANENKYTVPFGVDASSFFSELNKMDAGLDNIGASAIDAGKQIQGAFTQSSKSADDLLNSLGVNTKAVQLLRDQATKAGVDIANSLSGKGIDAQFGARIDAIKNKLKGLTSTAVNVDVNFDESKIIALEQQIKTATDATAEFNTVIQFAKDQLATMDAGGQQFITLQNQIKSAEEFITQLNNAISLTVPSAEELGQAFNTAFGDPGRFFNARELQALDDQILNSTSEVEALNAQVTALATKLATLKPNDAAFEEFTNAVTAGNQALQALGAETVSIGASEDKAAESTVNFRTQLRNIRQEMAQLFAAGQQNTEQFQNLEAEAIRVGNAMKNASVSIKALSSNTVGLEAGTQAVTALGGAFIAAQGAVTIFGDDSAKAQQVTQKLYLALAALQGITQLANALQKDSILTLLLLSATRQKETVAVVENTAAMEGEAVAMEADVVATEAATTATVGFTAALLLNPITLIVVAILAAAVAIIEFASATDAGTKAVDRLNLALDLEKDLFNNNVKVIQEITQQTIAFANQRGAKESEITQITIESLQKQLRARNSYLKEITAHYTLLQQQLDKGVLDQKQFTEESDKLDKEYTTAREANTADIAAIDLARINEKTQTIKEDIQLDQQLIQESNSNYSARKQIQNAILSFIKDAHKEEESELTRDNDKQIQTIKDAGKDKLDAVKSSIADISEKIKENNAQIGLIGRQAAVGIVDPEVGAKQIADLRAQNTLLSKEQKAAAADLVSIKNSTDLQLLQAQKDFEQKQLDLTLKANDLIAQTEEDGNQKDLHILKAKFDQQVEQIKEQFKNNASLQGLLISNLTAQYANAILSTTEAFKQKVIAQDSTLAQLRLENSGKYALDSTSQQNKLQVQLLKIQLDAAIKSRAQMVDDGKKDTQIAIETADNLILKLQNQLKQAGIKANTVDIFDVLGLGNLKDDQKAVLTGAFNDIMSGVKQVTDAVVAGYQKQIDAKQTLIDSNTQALQTLESQLATEEGLQQKGLANNVAGIQAQIDAKNKQIADEKTQQQQIIKQRQAAQRAQAAIDAAAELGNLIVSSTNIFKASTAAFGPIGVPIAIVAIAAMTAGFVASQIKANQAINAANTATATFAEGGEITGKKHTGGGQKYRSIDGSGHVLELEDGEFVVKSSVTDKHGSFLEALNNEQLNDSHLREFLHSIGIPLESDMHKQAIADIEEHTAAKSSYININNADISSEDLKAIRQSTEYLAERRRGEPERWEDDDFYYTLMPGKLTKKKKR